MVIEPEIEEPARRMLGCAVRGELDQLAALMTELAPERFLQCLGLYVRVSGYIAIDVSGPGWPTDAHQRRLAQLMAGVDLDFSLEEPDVYAFLSRSALGFEPVFDVFPDKERAAIVPVLTTAALLASYRTGGQHWWDYLDIIERSFEQAASLPQEAFPAVLLWTQSNRAPKSRQAGDGTAGA